MVLKTSNLSDLLLTSKDGDWGKDVPQEGFVPYRVIRGGDFPDVRYGDISKVPRCYLDKKSVDRRTLQEKDILIETAGGTRDRPTGRTIFITNSILKLFDLPVTCASFARFLRIDPKKAVPEYIYWYLQHLYESGEMWQHQVQHTGVARFQYTRFAESVEIPLPSTDEQRYIAHILSTLDDKTKLNRKVNQTLESIIQAIFKSWFIDFDPVKAKASGESIESIYHRLGLTPEIISLFSDSFEDSEIGDIPNGWTVKGLDDVAHYLNGLALQKYPLQGTKSLPIIKIAQLRAGHTNGADCASSEVPEEYVITDGDVLFSWSGSLEVEIWCGGPGALNQHIFKVTSDKFPKWFYYLWTKHHLPSFRDIAANKATTMGHIQRLHLSEAKVLVPNPDLIKEMNSFFEPIIEKMIIGNIESRTLTSLRDTLLPKLLSGEIHVKFSEEP